MKSSVLEIIGPKHIVGLKVRESHIGIVQLRNTLGGPEVEHVLYQEVDNPERLADELDDLFRAHKLSRDFVVSSLPSSRALFREIDPEFDNPRKLDKIIKYQMEPHVPYPIDDLLVDFLPDAGKTSVTAVGVSIQAMNQHMALLRDARVTPSIVTVDDFALHHLATLSEDSNRKDALAIINLDPEGPVLLVIYRGTLDFIRALPRLTNDTSWIHESLSIYGIKRPEAEVSEVLVTGAQADGEYSEMPMTAWRPFDAIAGAQSPEPHTQQKLSVPLALAMLKCRPPGKLVNFCRGEYAVNRTKNLKSTVAYCLSAFFALIVLVTLNLYMDVYRLEAQYNDFNEQTRRLLLSTFPDTITVIKGKELDILRQKIAEAKERHGLGNIIGPDKSILNVLSNLTHALSNFEATTVDNIIIDEKVVRLDGTTLSFKIVDNLQDKLDELKFFSKVSLVSATLDSNKNRIRYNFALDKQ